MHRMQFEIEYSELNLSQQMYADAIADAVSEISDVELDSSEIMSDDNKFNTLLDESGGYVEFDDNFLIVFMEKLTDVYANYIRNTLLGIDDRTEDEKRTKDPGRLSEIKIKQDAFVKTVINYIKNDKNVSPPISYKLNFRARITKVEVSINFNADFVHKFEIDDYIRWIYSDGIDYKFIDNFSLYYFDQEY